MPPQDPATEKQMMYLWNLIQGGYAMGLQPQMAVEVQTEEAARGFMTAGMTRERCSQMIEDLIFRVGAVPPGSGLDDRGQPKVASDKQIKFYRTVASELASWPSGPEPQWMKYEMAGRSSWTVSKWISRLMDIKEYKRSQDQPGMSVTGQQQAEQQPAAPGVDFQPAPPPQFGVPSSTGVDTSGPFV